MYHNRWAIVPHVALFIPGRKRHGPSSLTLSRLHIETLQWTFMAWFKICGSVFIDFSSLLNGAKMLLLCLDFYSSMAVRLQNGNKCRRLDYHTPGISAFTFFLLLCFLSQWNIFFYFAHFYNDWFILSLQLALKIKEGEGWRADLGSEINHLTFWSWCQKLFLSVPLPFITACPASFHGCFTFPNFLHL